MLIENQVVLMTWTSRNKKYYMSKGYKFTKMYEQFEVKLEDVPLQSHVEVLVKCDYCGDIIKVKYQNYNNRKCTDNKYACGKCKKYNIKASVLNKYGVENIFQVEEVKSKIKETNLNKYGSKYYSSTDEWKVKVKQTSLERYGKEFYAQTEEYKEKTICTNLKNRGYKYHTQDPKVIEKIIKSFANNNSGKVSKPQYQLFLLLNEMYGNCELNYPCGGCLLDCVIVVNDIKIDVEFDGEFWHKHKEHDDRKRNYFVLSQGYKIIRILGNRVIPSKQEIENAVNQLIFDDKHLIKITTDIK